jgi:hypothetical protein
MQQSDLTGPAGDVNFVVTNGPGDEDKALGRDFAISERVG